MSRTELEPIGKKVRQIIFISNVITYYLLGIMSSSHSFHPKARVPAAGEVIARENQNQVETDQDRNQYAEHAPVLGAGH